MQMNIGFGQVRHLHRLWTRCLCSPLLASAAVGGAALAEAPASRAAATSYRLIPLDSDRFAPALINAQGQVTVEVRRHGRSRVVFYDGQRLRHFGTLGGPGATAAGLNDHGQVTGTSSIAANGTILHPYRWSRQTGMLDLGRAGLGNPSSMASITGAMSTAAPPSPQADGQKRMDFSGARVRGSWKSAPWAKFSTPPR